MLQSNKNSAQKLQNKCRTNCIIRPPPSLKAMNCDKTRFEKFQSVKSQIKKEQKANVSSNSD